MPADSARDVLDIFVHFDGRPGHVLLANHFLAVGGRRGLTASELQAGIKSAHCQGWLEPADRGWRLTEKGFSEATKQLPA